jgi:hypothetical protein
VLSQVSKARPGAPIFLLDQRPQVLMQGDEKCQADAEDDERHEEVGVGEYGFGS